MKSNQSPWLVILKTKNYLTKAVRDSFRSIGRVSIFFPFAEIHFARYVEIQFVPFAEIRFAFIPNMHFDFIYNFVFNFHREFLSIPLAQSLINR